MTSIEWLVKELYNEMNMSGDGRVLDEILEEAKEMHKVEIIDAWNSAGGGDAYHQGKEYYQETFVSKGSDTLKDYHIVDTNEIVFSKTAFEILQSKLTIADTFEFREIYLPQILDAMEEYKSQLPQHPPVFSENGNELLFDKGGNLIKELPKQEISDEEIEKAFKDASERLSEYKEGLIDGAKWYREQLKNK